MAEEPEFDPEIDIDPNDAMGLYPDEETDTEEDPANDQAGEAGEPVEGARPVDLSLADEDLIGSDEEEDEA